MLRIRHVSPALSLVSLAARQKQTPPRRSSTAPRSTRTPPVILNFQDARAAYASMGSMELFRSRVVLYLCGTSWIVDNNERLMKFSRALLPKVVFEWLMRRTFYGQFVGGVDVEDLRPKLAKMQEYGVRPILDYSVEADLGADTDDTVPETQVVDPQDPQFKQYKQFKQDKISSQRNTHHVVARSYPYLGEENCEKNLAIFMECLKTAGEVCEQDAFSAIKVTGLAKPNALLEGSQLLVEIKHLFIKYSEVCKDTLPTYLNLKHLPKDVLGPIHLLVQHRMTLDNFKQLLSDHGASLGEDEITDLFSLMLPDEQGRVKFHKFREMSLPGPPDKPLYSLLTTLKKQSGSPVITQMNRQHITALNRVEERLIRLCDHGVQLDAKILIDAEQTYFQPLIDFFANKLMSRYNQDTVTIFNTYQCYLKGTPSQLIYDAEKANLLGYKFGAKLVRGAYMEQERQRAADLDYEDPIYPDKAHTNSCYINMFEILLSQIEQRKCEVMIASHNEFSIQYVVEKMRQSDINPADGGIYFGQLLGMCDQVTYLLGANGYCSYKYVPYGPIEAVLPYLSRRAYENKGMLKGSQKEIELLKGEFRGRIKRRIRQGISSTK